MKQRFIEFLRNIECYELFVKTMEAQNIYGSMDKLFEFEDPEDYVTSLNWSANSHYYWRGVDVVWKKIVANYE